MMLERIETPDGIVYYRSPGLHAIGVPHAFSTRLGGMSAAPFDSMNLGNPNGCAIQDDYEHIWANYARLQGAIGVGSRTLLRVHQVHGAIIADAPAGQPFSVHTRADAIVTDDPAVMASVRIADCVPVLLATRDGRRVAAVHAGWRGVVAGIVPLAVRRLLHLDHSSPAGTSADGTPVNGKVPDAGTANGKGDGAADVVAAIGPCIGFDAFEVGEEVLTAFERLFDPAPIRRCADGKGRVDLREAVRRQLIAAGVPESHIDTTDRCTFNDRDEFFSHRRDQGITGRMAALIGVIA